MFAKHALVAILVTAHHESFCAKRAMQQRWATACALSATQVVLPWLEVSLVHNAQQVPSPPPAVAAALHAHRGSLQPKGAVCHVSHGRRARQVKDYLWQVQAPRTTRAHLAFQGTRSRHRMTRRHACLSLHALHTSKKRSPQLRGQTVFACRVLRATPATAVRSAHHAKQVRLPPMVALCARLVQQVSFRQLRGLQHADHVTQGVSLRQQRLNALVGAHVLLVRAQFMRARLRATALVLHALLVRRGQRQTMPHHAPQ